MAMKKAMKRILVKLKVTFVHEGHLGHGPSRLRLTEPKKVKPPTDLELLTKIAANHKSDQAVRGQRNGSDC